MTPEEWNRVRDLLESALELDPSFRSGFLEEVCTDASIRLEVESLIRMDEVAGPNFLNSAQPAPSFSENGRRSPLLPGNRIGAYEVLEEIAQGGMGVVYRAIRADGQYSQEVALKI